MADLETQFSELFSKAQVDRSCRPIVSNRQISDTGIQDHMPLSPESLYEFVFKTRQTLLRTHVSRKRVLLPRLGRAKPAGCNTTRCLSTATNLTNPSSSHHDQNFLKVAGTPIASTLPSPSSLAKKLSPRHRQQLPTTCPGCGALTQDVDSEEAGHYSVFRPSVKKYLKEQSVVHSQPADHATTATLIEDSTSHDPDDKSKSGDQEMNSYRDADATPAELPICDRCHDLLYYNKGQSIAHPTLENLADSIMESSYARNHVYHVVDAVDFPMSLVPGIFRTLELAKPRSQNRRARTKFTSKPTISFIITRSDLLGSSKTMVDSMMPYFQSTLRTALGRQARDIRLGNVHLVSAKRGWWTKDIKDSIWERGGASWMVGKANVGKSNLFPVLFPKGSGERAPVYGELQKENDTNSTNSKAHKAKANRDEYLQENMLLPPAQPEVNFPAMPIVSHLPGTTASPIRLSFGNHKGEVVDLPGLERGNMEQYVHQEHKSDIVMRSRPNVKQHIVKHGQSLLLGGGLIRITPQLDSTDPSMTLLAYPFVPIDAHVTSTEKAAALQLGQRESGIKSIMAKGVGESIKSSGKYTLEADVTKSRAGPLMRAGVPIANLPFRVYSCDILVEGVGWVELVCQVRKSRKGERKAAELSAQPSALTVDTSFPSGEASLSSDSMLFENSRLDFKPFSEQTPLTATTNITAVEDDFTLPLVEVFSPRGQHVSSRRPLGAWMLWHEASELRRKSTTGVRPRKPMKGAKKKAKLEKRADLSAQPKGLPPKKIRIRHMKSSDA